MKIGIQTPLVAFIMCDHPIEVYSNNNFICCRFEGDNNPTNNDGVTMTKITWNEMESRDLIDNDLTSGGCLEKTACFTYHMVLPHGITRTLLAQDIGETDTFEVLFG